VPSRNWSKNSSSWICSIIAARASADVPAGIGPRIELDLGIRAERPSDRAMRWPRQCSSSRVGGPGAHDAYLEGAHAMATVFADRNLLVGILALQHGLIDRDTLVEAMQAWLSDCKQPLEHFIRDRGRLNPEDELLLEALVSAHSGQHGDESGQGSVREVLGRIAETDPSGARSWATTCVRGESSEARLAGSGHSVGCPTTSGHRFHVVRHHARGGL